MSADHCQGIGGTIRTPESMSFHPTPVIGVAMYFCVQLCGCRQAPATEVFAARGALNVLLGLTPPAGCVANRKS
jgi:hypothetical protein